MMYYHSKPKNQSLEKITRSPDSMLWKTLDIVTDYGGLAMTATSAAMLSYFGNKGSVVGHHLSFGMAAISTFVLPIVNTKIRNLRYDSKTMPYGMIDGKHRSANNPLSQMLRNMTAGIIGCIYAEGAHHGELIDIIKTGEGWAFNIIFGGPSILAELSNRADKYIYKNLYGQRFK